MKIRLSQLRSIIKEEVQNAISAAPGPNFVINFYPSEDEYQARIAADPKKADYVYFTGLEAKDFTPAEKSELKSAIAAAGGVMRFVTGQGPGAPPAVAVRGELVFGSKQEAMKVAQQILGSLSPELSDRLEAGAVESRRKPGMPAAV